MRWRSIILNGYAGHPPMLEGDGTQGGAGEAAPVVTDTQTPPVETTSEGIGPMRFGELNRENNPIFKALNDDGQGTPPATVPRTDSNVATPPAAEPAPQQTDALTSVMEQIKQINPKAAEKYNSPASIAKALINQEKTITNLFQTKAQLETQLNNLNSQIEEYKNKPQEPSPTPTPELTPEQLEEMKAKELELIMENPLEYRKNILELAKKEALDEFRKEFKPVKEVVEAEQTAKEISKEANDLVESFKTATNENGELLYPDFEELASDMAEIFDQYPVLLADRSNLRTSLEIAYKMVKGNSPNPEVLVNDENFVNQYILNNEAITQKVAKNYVQSVKAGQPPVVISGQPGGASPASPVEKPLNLKDAGKAAKKHYNW